MQGQAFQRENKLCLTVTAWHVCTGLVLNLPYPEHVVLIQIKSFIFRNVIVVYMCVKSSSTHE